MADTLDNHESSEIELQDRNEAEMRALYQSIGISPKITEAAIRARRLHPLTQRKRTGLHPVPKTPS